MGHSDRKLGLAVEAADFVRRADAHRADALAPLVAGRGAPCRVCAVHALDLYLVAFLTARAVVPDRGRGAPALAAHARQAAKAGLALRPRTLEFLEAMAHGREDVVARDETALGLGGGNRLAATLEEVGSRVAAGLG